MRRGDSKERCGQRGRRARSQRAVVRGLDFISVMIGCHWGVLHRGVVCSDLCYRRLCCYVEGGPWRDRTGEKETTWEAGPKTQVLVVSWSRAVTREVLAVPRFVLCYGRAGRIY